jgi:hypothetical protein
MIQYNLNGREGNSFFYLIRWRFLYKRRGDNHGSKDFQLERKDGAAHLYSNDLTKNYHSRDAKGNYPPYTDYYKLVCSINHSTFAGQQNDLL